MSVYQDIIKGVAKFPGLKSSYHSDPYWGGGYCKICGETDYQREQPYHTGLVPRQVRFWDCDDGWKVGILCRHCIDDVAHRGPKETDYAVQSKAINADEGLMDAISNIMGEDADGLESLL